MAIQCRGQAQALWLFCFIEKVRKYSVSSKNFRESSLSIVPVHPLLAAVVLSYFSRSRLKLVKGTVYLQIGMHPPAQLKCVKNSLVSPQSTIRCFLLLAKIAPLVSTIHNKKNGVQDKRNLATP
jgi:hypothetical protein